MAKSIQTLRNSILTSIHGRRLGLDTDEFMVGPKTLKLSHQQIGIDSTGTTVSNTGTSILNYGFTSLTAVTSQTSGASTGYPGTGYGTKFLLDAPAEGVEKVIYTASNHSTAEIEVIFSTGVTGNTSVASTYSGLAFNAKNQFVRLIGLSTAKWLMAGISTGATLGASA